MSSDNPEHPTPEPGSRGEITVVIPVFNAFDSVVVCLQGLDRHSPGCRVILIDDASDDPRIRPLLREWVATRQRSRLIELQHNRGFVHAANLGAGSCDGDIVLLNSDTLVTSYWLDSLKRCLYSDRRIASATPWSNNGEIVSVPVFCQTNAVPEDPDHWARAARASTDGTYPEIPTAVGFCMAVSRTAIETVGLFDEATFGRGYGEENDFSFRARSSGFRNVLCTDAFVAHEGGQSFGPLGVAPGDASMQRLLGKHPDYLQEISTWIEADPLAPYRTRLLDEVDGGSSGKISASEARD